MHEPVDLKQLLLMNILQYFKNQYTGFAATLHDLQTLPEKEKFITDCKRLVESGWSDDFNDIESLEIFKPYFTDPVENLHVTYAQIDIARFLIQLCIFKLIANACEESPVLNNDKTWFRHMRDTLNREFAALCSGNHRATYTYDGKQISSLQDLEKLTQQMHRERDWGSGGTVAIVFFCAVFGLFKWYERDYASSDVKRYLPAAFLLAVFGMLAVMLRQIIRHGSIQFFVDHTRPRLQQAQVAQALPNLMDDAAIAQHIVVNEDRKSVV